ncbi:MAG: SAM-dependent methyltransferase [Ponticaulis sp.]|nr:SAM-dependent methyltransferase [Ponticaulis sp.]|tara:strand:- start:38526 stop:39752 length:1227 start_codon:yes stop_codon:yes gene_type:complete
MTDAVIIRDLPDVKQIKHLPASVRLAFLALRSTDKGRLRVFLPDGRQFLFDKGKPGPSAVIKVHDLAMVRRVLTSGDIGFAEAYMDDQFSTPDLTKVLLYFAVNFESAGRLSRGSPLKNAATFILNALTRQNTRKGSKQNILAHYDLGNAFYDKWLDPSMTYSSALFQGTEDLSVAQTRKYDLIARQIDAGPDRNLLEIGSGWGGFAEHAAKTYGSNVKTITISDEQHAYASRRMFEEGLNEKVKVELCDYRDVQGKYDGIASIEMFEAVGESYWPSYFRKISDCLSSGKRAALQIITIEDELFESYRKRVDFIQKYIFPGGMLPSRSALDVQFKNAGLTFEKATMFGQDYARTLKQWADEFRGSWSDIETLGFDRKFRNLWEYYLCYCEAGFTTGRTDVGQFVVSKP